MRSLAVAILAIFCASCSNPSPQNGNAWQEIPGRGDAVYRARVPEHWQRIAPPATFRFDTREPLVSFEPAPGVRVVVHSFPCASLERRIPPKAQVTRWLRQLPAAVQVLSEVVPSGHGGYAGLRLEAPGLMAWAFSLGDDQFQALESGADLTIKATGTPESIRALRDELIAFARSLELCEAIPVRS